MRHLFVLLAVVAALIIVLLLLQPEPPFQPEEGERPLSRTYPAVIKGNWEPSTWDMDRLLDEDVQSLKALGVNTVSIVPHYSYWNGRPVPADGKESHLRRIIAAKELGFAVLLTPDFVGGEGEKAAVPLEQFLADALAITLEWAAVAEAYQVEFFAPQNELDWFIRYSFFGDDPARLEDAVEVTNRWHAHALQGIKKVYTGKTIYKAASETGLLNATGYDYLGIDFGHYQRSLADFRQGVRALYQAAAAVADKSSSGWLVGEAWMPYRQRTGPFLGDVLKNADGQPLDDLQDDYFRIAAEEYAAFSGSPLPSGFIFIAYRMGGMDVKGRPAERVLQDFFASL